MYSRGVVKGCDIHNSCNNKIFFPRFERIINNFQVLISFNLKFLPPKKRVHPNIPKISFCFSFKNTHAQVNDDLHLSLQQQNRSNKSSRRKINIPRTMAAISAPVNPPPMIDAPAKNKCKISYTECSEVE